MTFRKSNNGSIYYSIDAMGCITGFGIITWSNKYHLSIERWSERPDHATWQKFIHDTHETNEDAFQRFLAEYIKLHENVLSEHLPAMEEITNKLKPKPDNNDQPATH